MNLWLTKAAVQGPPGPTWTELKIREAVRGKSAVPENLREA